MPAWIPARTRLPTRSGGRPLSRIAKGPPVRREAAVQGLGLGLQSAGYRDGYRDGYGGCYSAFFP